MVVQNKRLFHFIWNQSNLGNFTVYIRIYPFFYKMDRFGCDPYIKVLHILMSYIKCKRSLEYTVISTANSVSYLSAPGKRLRQFIKRQLQIFTLLNSKSEIWRQFCEKCEDWSVKKNFSHDTCVSGIFIFSHCRYSRLRITSVTLR